MPEEPKKPAEDRQYYTKEDKLAEIQKEIDRLVAERAKIMRS